MAIHGVYILPEPFLYYLEIIKTLLFRFKSHICLELPGALYLGQMLNCKKVMFFITTMEALISLVGAIYQRLQQKILLQWKYQTSLRGDQTEKLLTSGPSSRKDL